VPVVVDSLNARIVRVSKVRQSVVAVIMCSEVVYVNKPRQIPDLEGTAPLCRRASGSREAQRAISMACDASGIEDLRTARSKGLQGAKGQALSRDFSLIAGAAFANAACAVGLAHSTRAS